MTENVENFAKVVFTVDAKQKIPEMCVFVEILYAETVLIGFLPKKQEKQPKKLRLFHNSPWFFEISSQKLWLKEIYLSRFARS